MLIRSMLAIFALASLGSARQSVDSESVSRGQQQFKQSCAFCHGANGDGGTEGPSLIRSAILRHDSNGELIGPVIRDGRPEKGMPRLGLAPGQISDIVAFLHDELKRLDRTSPDEPSKERYSLQVLLVGDAATGKTYFNGGGGCVGCHSLSGDLAGIAGKFSPVDLQTRMLYPTGKPPAVTVTAKSGTVVRGTLVAMDAFHVEMHDAEGWYHSWPLTDVRVKVQDPLAAHRQLLKTITDTEIHNLFAYLETLR
jgi:cytochrome c oxidase cbb3-type subunit 3